MASQRGTFGPDTASHIIAAYAGWRLAERSLRRARQAAESDLASAYTAAERHAPLRGAIEGLARPARLTVQLRSLAPVAPYR